MDNMLELVTRTFQSASWFFIYNWKLLVSAYSTSVPKQLRQTQSHQVLEQSLPWKIAILKRYRIGAAENQKFTLSSSSASSYFVSYLACKTVKSFLYCFSVVIFLHSVFVILISKQQHPSRKSSSKRRDSPCHNSLKTIGKDKPINTKNTTSRPKLTGT